MSAGSSCNHTGSNSFCGTSSSRKLGQIHLSQISHRGRPTAVSTATALSSEVGVAVVML